jgi:hypothetical protein
MATSSVSAGVMKGLFDFAESRGANADELSARSGVFPADLSDHDSRVPFARYEALFRQAQQLCGDPALALHYAESTDMSEHSIVGLIMNASTMVEAMQGQRYGRPAATRRRRPALRLFSGWSSLDGRCTRQPERLPGTTEGAYAHVAGPPSAAERPGDSLSSRPVIAQNTTGCSSARWCSRHWNAMRMHRKCDMARALQPRYVFGIPQSTPSS